MRLLSILFLVFLATSCMDDSTKKVETKLQQESEEILNKGDIDGLKYIEFLPDQKVVKQISGWEKYSELDRLIIDVKNANFSFFRDNAEILNTFCEELISTIPKGMNTPQINSRVIVLQTKLFKLESVVGLSNVNKKQLLESVKELLIAFSNLNLQMNKKVEKESQNIRKPN